MTTQTLRCRACGLETEHTRLFEKWGYPIVRCRECGLGSAIAADFRAGEYYGRDYFHGGRADGYADYEGSAPVLRREFGKVLDRLRRHVRGGKLLEIGSAYGYLLDEAGRDFQCTGVDVSADSVASCRARGLDVHCGDLAADAALQQEIAGRAPFDAAVMLDAIEHLTDPDAMVARLATLVRPGGALVITTGDAGSLHARLLGPRWRLMTPPQHLFYFSRGALARLLARHGFEVLESRKPWKVVPVGLAVYQLTRRLGLELRAPEALSHVGVPLNLFDTMQVVARRR
jgi:SAM-dependent methyltransferase